MKKNIALLLMLISSFNYSQNKEDTKTDIEWNTYSNKTYSINYPKKWKVKGGKLSLMTGKKADFLSREWTLIITSPRNKERIEFFFNVESDYEDYKITKKPIIIDSIKGFHYTYTKGDEYLETVLLKTKKRWFRFDNNEIKDENFKGFYSSFNYKKK
jgi:hypothetical protein